MKVNIILLFTILFSCQKNDLIEKKTYFSNGNIKQICFINSKGILNGVYKVFYKNGNIESISNFKNNKLHGIQKYYEKNGYIIIKKRYYLDKCIDNTLYFYKNGSLDYLFVIYKNEFKKIEKYFYSNGFLKK